MTWSISKLWPVTFLHKGKKEKNITCLVTFQSDTEYYSILLLYLFYYILYNIYYIFYIFILFILYYIILFCIVGYKRNFTNP